MQCAAQIAVGGSRGSDCVEHLHPPDRGAQRAALWHRARSSPAQPRSGILSPLPACPWAPHPGSCRPGPAARRGGGAGGSASAGSRRQPGRVAGEKGCDEIAILSTMTSSLPPRTGSRVPAGRETELRRRKGCGRGDAEGPRDAPFLLSAKGSTPPGTMWGTVHPITLLSSPGRSPCCSLGWAGAAGYHFTRPCPPAQISQLISGGGESLRRVIPTAPAALGMGAQPGQCSDNNTRMLCFPSMQEL